MSQPNEKVTEKLNEIEGGKEILELLKKDFSKLYTPEVQKWVEKHGTEIALIARGISYKSKADGAASVSA